MSIKTILAVVFFCLLMQSCIIFSPEFKKNKGGCELLSQKSKLVVHKDIPPECTYGAEICFASLLASASSSIVVSSSIVLVGNTVHWLERQGKCEDGLLKIKVDEFKHLMTKQSE